MIMSFEGDQGTGKTTGAVMFGYYDYKYNGLKVISNTPLQFPHTRFTLEYFKEHLLDNELQDCAIIWDEMYQVLDARSHGSKINKSISYFVYQARKRRVNLYFCTHYLDYLEMRIRRVAQVRGACNYYEEKPCKKCGGSGKNGTGVCERCLGYGKVGFSVVRCLNRKKLPLDVLGMMTNRKNFDISYFTNEFWHLFNTDERVNMPAKVLDFDSEEVGALV